MQLTSLAQLCLFAIFHYLSIDALPNKSVVQVNNNQNWGKSSIETPVTRNIFQANDKASVYKFNSLSNQWDTTSDIMVKIRQNNNKYHLVGISESGGSGNKSRIALNIEDFGDAQLQHPGPQYSYIRWNYQNDSYDLKFVNQNDAELFYQVTSQMKQQSTIPSNQPAAIENPEQQEIYGQNGVSTGPTNHDQLQSNNPAGNSNQHFHICTISTQHYDCQIQGVTIRDGESHEFRNEPGKQVITFRDSVLRFLPKSLVDAFPNMKILNLNELKIASIDNNAFDNARTLEQLYLEGNRLETFPTKVLSGAIMLKTLTLSDNDIKSMPYVFKSNKLLEDFYVNGNKLNQLPTFENIPHLKTFNGSHNKLDRIDSMQFSKQTQIKEIDLSYNLLMNLVLKLPPTVTLEIVDISNNELTNLDIPLRIERLNIENNKLSTFDAGEECLLKFLNISKNQLEAQPILNCHSLEVLDVSNNLLESFKYSQTLENLQNLNLGHNNLFEFSIPTKSKIPLALVSLDLSHNKLSYLSSLPSFPRLKNLKLNNNKLIAIQHNSLPNRVEHLFMSNNEWKCEDVPSWARLVRDENNICNEGFKTVEGICCKNYRKAFNDLLNDKVRDAYFHEQSNYDRLKHYCAYKKYSATNDDIEHIKTLASEADENMGKIYRDIANIKQSVVDSQKNLDDIKVNHNKFSNFKRNMANLIENKRSMYQVTKEGLVNDKDMLSRVIKFVQERNTFSDDLLNRRRSETINTSKILEQKNQEKAQLTSSITEIASNITSMKAQEKVLKKEVEKLQKEVNRNAPSIYGKSG